MLKDSVNIRTTDDSENTCAHTNTNQTYQKANILCMIFLDTRVVKGHRLDGLNDSFYTFSFRKSLPENL